MLSSHPFSSRLRRFMPLFDEIERMEHELWSDSWFTNNDRYLTNNQLPAKRSGDGEDQKMLTDENKASSEDTSVATRSGSDDWLSSLWSGFGVNNEISLKIEEQNEKYVVTANIPNFDKEHMKLQVRDGLLTVSGEQVEEQKDENSYSKSSKFVSRSIRLPENINQQGITAKYENGVLNVQIPKSDKTRTKSDQILIE